MPTPMKKAVGYVRVSSPNQAKEGESLKTQRKQIKHFAKSREWQLIHIYEDAGISGAAVEHRTAFQKMIADAKAGQFNMIIFAKFSRFARNAREYLNYSEELKEYNVHLASVKDNLDPSTATGKLMCTVLAGVAEWELEVIREQMLENKLARWMKHEVFIGQPPFGYTWNKETKQLDIVPAQADLYRRIVTMYVDRGLSLLDIADKLNDEGLMEGRRARWSNIAISYILKNKAYYGHLVVNQYEYESCKNGPTKKRSTKKKKPASEHIAFPITALISKSRWDEIQKKIQFNTVKSKRHSDNTKEFFLRDVLVCARCGSKVKPYLGRPRKDGSAKRYYVCYWRKANIKKLRCADKPCKCSLPYIPAEEVENKIWSDIIVNFAMNPKKKIGKLYEPKRHKSKIRALGDQVHRIQKELTRKKTVRKNLFDLLGDDTFDRNELGEKLQQNKDEMLGLESKLYESQQELRALQELKDREDELKLFIKSNKKFFKKIVKEISNLDMEDRKLLIESVLDGPIKVDFEEPSEDSAGGASIEYSGKKNIEILQRFMDEGKISKLDKNGRL